jgi:hypothetical protein
MKELVKRRITTYRLRYDWAANTAEVDLPTEDDEKEEQDNLTLKSRVSRRDRFLNHRRGVRLTAKLESQ